MRDAWPIDALNELQLDGAGLETVELADTTTGSRLAVRPVVTIGAATGWRQLH